MQSSVLGYLQGNGAVLRLPAVLVCELAVLRNVEAHRPLEKIPKIRKSVGRALEPRRCEGKSVTALCVHVRVCMQKHRKQLNLDIFL